MPLAAGLYYTVYEGGNQEQKPVILIHGAGSDHLCWPAELRRLTGYTVLAVDLPGHGRSEGVGAQSIEAYTAALVDLLATLKLYQAVFIGHSMGGAIALNMALDYPQHTAAIGLISSGAYLGVPQGMVQALSSPLTAPAGLQTLQELLSSTSLPAALSSKVMEGFKKTRPSVLYGDWLACSRFDLRRHAAEIGIPAYVACGTEDRLTPPQFSNFLANTLPNATLQTFTGAGHMLVLERACELRAGILGLLETLKPSPLPEDFNIHKTPAENAQISQTKPWFRDIP